LKTYRFWCLDQYWANALVQQGDIDGALAFAESQLKGPRNNDAWSIEAFCEGLGLSRLRCRTQNDAARFRRVLPWLRTHGQARGVGRLRVSSKQLREVDSANCDDIFRI